MTRRTQNSQESIDSQKGAGQPVQLQAVSVEHHRRRIARRPVGVRAQQLSRRLSGKLHPRCVLQDSERNQSRNMGAPQPPHLAAFLDLYEAFHQAATEKP